METWRWLHLHTRFAKPPTCSNFAIMTSCQAQSTTRIACCFDPSAYPSQSHFPSVLGPRLSATPNLYLDSGGSWASPDAPISCQLRFCSHEKAVRRPIRQNPLTQRDVDLGPVATTHLNQSKSCSSRRFFGQHGPGNSDLAAAFFGTRRKQMRSQAGIEARSGGLMRYSRRLSPAKTTQCPRYRLLHLLFDTTFISDVNRSWHRPCSADHSFANVDRSLGRPKRLGDRPEIPVSTKICANHPCAAATGGHHQRILVASIDLR